MALALVIPVLLGAIIGGRIAGVVTRGGRGLSFDFFFTSRTSRCASSSKDDVATFVVLAHRGARRGRARVRARRGGVARERRAPSSTACYRVAELSARGADVDDVVSSARAELIGLFGLDRVCVRGRRGPAPSSRASATAARSKHAAVASGDFLLPDRRGRGAGQGPRPRPRSSRALRRADTTRAPLEKRLVAVAIADELGAALASAQQPNARRSLMQRTFCSRDARQRGI